MVKAWFLVAVMVGMYSDGTKDIFIFQHPEEHGHFHSSQECHKFAETNPLPIMKALIDTYGPKRHFERILCLPEEKVSQFLEEPNMGKTDI